MTIEPYLCKLTNLTFTTPCSVTSCPAHVGNLNRCGVKVVSTTYCAHADFSNQGFPESLSYAVEEQGFVGYRDLKYMESFFNVNEIDLRDIYTQNVEVFRKIVALVWAVHKDTVDEARDLHYCRDCGHPTKSNVFKCISSSICSDRQEIVTEELREIVSSIPAQTRASFFNVLWRSLKEKFTPSIDITQDTLLKMNEVKGPPL